MPKINVYLPDDLAEAVKESGVPVSAICQRALEQAVRRLTVIRSTAMANLDADALATRLPHFTARARSVLVTATDRARGGEAPNVTTGDLLASLLAMDDNMALRVLTAMDIEPDQVARSLEPTAEPGLGDEFTLSRPAVNTLELAVSESTGLGHNFIGCEHLLLGLVGETDGAAGQLLRALGAEPKPTRRAVTAVLAGWRAGYVAQQTQSVPAAPAATLDAASVLRRELQPLIARIERLEQRAG
jgi:ATP-dependent Clp protease ATP-binding subunit ClpC